MALIYLVGVALAIGFALVLLLGRAPGMTEPPLESPTRGKSDHALVKELDGSLEEKVRFLVKLGFTDLEHEEEGAGKGIEAFRVKNPMPLAGGGYLVHFLSRRAFGDVVASPTVIEFASLVKHTEGVLKGVLVTGSAFSHNAWSVLEKAPVELIDGKQLEEIFKQRHPDQFPRDRV